MKVELKNVKFSEFASEETNCFQATVYIDGKKAGVVSNDGRGGPDYYAPHSLGETLNDYAKTLPKYEFYGKLHEHNAETFIGELFDNYQSEKKLKALLKTKYVFTVSGQHGIYSQKYYNEKFKTIMFHMSKSKVIETMGVKMSLSDLQLIADGMIHLVNWGSINRTMYFTTKEGAFELIGSYGDFNAIINFYTHTVPSDFSAKQNITSNLWHKNNYMRLHEAETRKFLGDVFYYVKSEIVEESENKQCVRELDIAGCDVYGEQLYDDSFWTGGLECLDVRNIDKFKMFSAPLFGVDFIERKAEPMYDF